MANRFFHRCLFIEAVAFGIRVNTRGVVQGSAKLTLKGVKILELRPFQGFLHAVKNVLEAPSTRALYPTCPRKPCG